MVLRNTSKSRLKTSLRRKTPMKFGFSVVFDFFKSPKFFYFLIFIFVIAGVQLVQEKQFLWGFGLFVISVLILTTIIFDRIPQEVPVQWLKKNVVSSKKTKSTVENESPFKRKMNWVSLILIGLSLFLGVKAQAWVVSCNQMPDWHVWGFFFLAGLLFVIGVSLGTKEANPVQSFSPKIEWLLFGAILVLSGFMRIYHLSSMPSGLFIDQGMEGWAALRILHEHFRPVWGFDVFQNPALLLYQLAGWFLFFKPTQFNFYLFFALMALASLVLVYWTFRQIGGQKTGLLSMFILGVMRWNINFSRDGFPTIEVPFYTFGTLAFLLYGIGSNKKWPFYVSAVFFAAGLYTYQSYQIVPLLVLVYAIYEMIFNWKGIAQNWKSIMGFCILFLVLAFPFIKHTVDDGGFGHREEQVSILKVDQDTHSWNPLINNFKVTMAMFNWRGDTNARHNLQNHRMLDDISGVLFIFGIVGSLIFFKKKPAFYGLWGLALLSIPAILSNEAPHANRMLATTPFTALLIAWPLVALWEKWEILFKSRSRDLFYVLLAVTLYFMAAQNYDLYFHQQATDIASWRESSVEETTIGKRVAKYGDQFDYFISPRYYGYYTINFLDYFHPDLVNNMVLPYGLISHDDATTSRGLYFALESGRVGVFDMLKHIYPTGVDETLMDPEGNPEVYFYKISADDLAKVKGLKAVFSRPINGVKEEQVMNFSTMPQGPYQAVLTGNLYIDQQGIYRWKFDSNVKASFWAKGHPVSSAGCYMAVGFHPIKIIVSVPAGESPLMTLFQENEKGKSIILNASDFNSLSAPQGLKGIYYRGSHFSGTPFLVEWDPILNYVNGNDFSAEQPFSVHWTGTFRADQSGLYAIFVRSSGFAGVKVDGKNWFELGKGKSAKGYLGAGIHSIDVYYWNNDEMFPYFTLCWAKPDGTQGVMPNSVFGNVP